MKDAEKLAARVARLLSKGGVVNYDQTKHVFRLVRKQLDLSPPKRRGRETVKRIPSEDLRRLLQYAQCNSATRGLMVRTLYETAVRVDEFVNLRMEHFLYEQRRIVVVSEKGDKRREVPLTANLTGLLHLHNGDRSEGPLFQSRRGNKFTSRRIQQVVAQVAQDAGLATRVTPHLLRHTRAADLVEAGMTRDQLRSILGHERSSTSHIYTRTANVITPDTYEAAARIIQSRL